MYQKFLVPFLCAIALVRGGVIGLHGLPGGQSVTTRSQDDYGNYAFGYDIVDEYGSTNGRQEKGDAHGNKVGSYVINDVDGRSRRVDYVADALGFRATVGTNEPGTATSNVGDATYLSTAPILTAAPAVFSASYAAPLLIPAPVIKSYAAPALLAPAPLALAATKAYPSLTSPYAVAPVAYGLTSSHIGLTSAH